MAEARTEQEPSIEEILESIRQIISEDGDAPAETSSVDLSADVPEVEAGGVLAAMPAAPADMPAEDDVILDLVDIVPQQAVDDQQEEPVQDFDIEIDLQDKTEEPVIMADTTTEEAEDTPISLLSGEAESSAADTMAKLLAGNFAVERELPGRVGKVTLEDMTRDLMRPLIKAWLDENLPSIVENIVTREVERVSRKALDR